MAFAQTAPEFPVPDFDAPEVAFGAKLNRYLTHEELPRKFYGMRHPMCEVASQLFFRGGRLADHNLRFKPEIDADKAFRAIRALLCSFDPKHEIKIGTVGVALSQWCEPINPEGQ